MFAGICSLIKRLKTNVFVQLTFAKFAERFAQQQQFDFAHFIQLVINGAALPFSASPLFGARLIPDFHRCLIFYLARRHAINEALIHFA